MGLARETWVNGEEFGNKRGKELIIPRHRPPQAIAQSTSLRQRILSVDYLSVARQKPLW